MLNWRAQQQKQIEDFEWVQPGVQAWVYNNNIMPGKKIFLDVEVIEIDNLKQKAKLKTQVTDKIESIFQLSIFDIFKKCDLSINGNINQEDIGTLPLVNAPEIFNFLKQNFENNQQYFYCGLDFYFINKHQQEFHDQIVQTNLEDQQESIKWLIDEKTLKPKKASVSAFIASVIKNFLMTFKKQSIFLQGEIQSGKSLHMIQILQFFCFYNKSDCQFLSTISLQRTKSSSSHVRRINIDSTLKLDSEKDKQITIQTQKLYFKSQIDFDSSKFDDKFEQSEIDKQAYYNKFNKKILLAYKIILPFVEVISINQKQDSACTKVFHLQSDEEFKFVSFQLEIKFLQTEYLKGDKNYNFMIFYYLFQGMDQDELRQRGLLQNIQKYDFLNDQIQVKNAKKFLMDLQNFLGDEQYDYIVNVLICIAEILTMQSQKISNQKIKFLETQFGVTEGVLGNYLREKKNFQQKKVLLYSFLYQNIIDVLLQKINSLTQKGNDLLTVYNCIEIIDSQGYNDLNRYGNYDDFNDNGYIEFTQNFINEKIFQMFNNQRFVNEKRIFKKEGLSEFLKEVDYRNNKTIVERLKQFIKILNQSSDVKDFKKILEKQYEVFLKSSFSLLNQKIENEEESFIYFVSLKHFFSQIVNYNLQDLFVNDQCIEQIEQEIRDILSKSFNFSDLRFQQAQQINGSKLKKQIQDIEDFFIQQQENQVHFFGALKVISLQQDQEYGKYLYKQFDSIDFQSQIERYKKNYPYRIDYRYLVDKFNVMNSAIHINPHLIVDYKNIVSNILLKMFGENHQEKFLLGKNQLFVKEDFFEHFDELIKELNEKQSRLDLFVHKAMNQLLKEHLDNSSKIIKIGRIFLEQNCCYNKYQRWKKAMNKMIENWRRKKKIQYANYIINICLNDIDYYNLRLLTKIQAHVRGFIWRLKHKRELTLLKQMKFKTTIKKSTQKAQECIDRLDQNTQKIILQRKQKLILNVLKQVMNLSQIKINQITREQKMEKTIRDLIYRYKFRRLIEKTRALKEAKKLIKRFILIQKFKQNIKNRIKKKRHLKRVKEYKEKHEVYVNIFKEHLKKNKFQNEQIKIFKPPSGKLKNEKVELYFQNLYLRNIKPIDQQDQFLNDYFDIMNKIIQTNDNILLIKCDDKAIQFLTKKQNLYMLQNQDNNIYQVKLPNKVFQIGYLENQIVFITQKSQIDYRNILFEKNKNNIMGDILNESDHTPFLIDTIKSNGWLILDFQQKYDQFVLTTHCHKLFIKNFQTNSTIKYSFKRKIQCFSIGLNFLIALDQGGVLYGLGDNSKGQLGIGDKGYQKDIILLEYLTKKKEIVKSLSCGESHTFVSTQLGNIYCWGDNQYNQLGSIFDNKIDYQILPQKYPSKYFPQNFKYVQIKCGQLSTYFLFQKKQLYALGTLDLQSVYVKPKKIDLTKTFANHELPVSLNVQYNANFEFVYLRCLSSKNSKFYNFVYFQKFANQIFKIFIQNNSALIPFQENISKDLNLLNMSTKLVEIKNKRVIKKQDKEMKEMFL